MASPRPLPYFYVRGFELKPDLSTTRAEMDAALRLNVSQGHVIKGTTSDAEYVAVGQAMNQAAGDPDAWGREVDVSVEIDGRRRRVTVRFSELGKVEAELLPDAGAWKPARSFRTAAEGLRALEKDFGISAIPDGRRLSDGWHGRSKRFTSDELEKIYDAVSRLGPDEQAALRGVQLARVDGLVGGAAGLFEYGNSVERGAASRYDRLVLGDGTFEGDGTGLATIAREGGHAMETATYRTATADLGQAVAAANAELREPWDAFNRSMSQIGNGGAAGVFAARANAAREALDELRLNKDPARSTALRQAARGAMAGARSALAAVTRSQQARTGKLMKSLAEIETVAARLADVVDALNPGPLNGTFPEIFRWFAAGNQLKH